MPILEVKELKKIYTSRFGGSQVEVDKDTLASRQTIGLEYIGSLQRLQEGLALGEGILREGLIARRRDIVTLHESLGVVLAALQHGTLFRRTDDHHVVQQRLLGKIVGDTRHKRRLGTYHEHLHTMADDKLADSLEVVDIQLDILADGSGAGIAGSNEELAALLALGNLVGDSVFASTGTKEQYIHLVT